LSLEENGSSGNPGRSAPGPTALVAPGPGIALWWCDLQASPARLRTCETHLSQAEQARASRFGMKRLRDRYVIGRGALRAILGRELGVDPAEVAIVRGKRGRPELAGVPTLDFNISHTDSVAIVALVRHGRVGVDIERLDRVINVVGIVRKFLTDHERLELAGSEADAARRRVLTLWTC
jgi:4'-phosphopantetheinyl transferase